MRVIPLAQQCIDTCIPLIGIISRHHRHGGIWALLRKSFSAAAFLIAASKKSTILQLPDDWRKWVNLTLTSIQIWEGGAPDLLWMRQILERMLENT